MPPTVVARGPSPCTPVLESRTLSRTRMVPTTRLSPLASAVRRALAAIAMFSLLSAPVAPAPSAEATPRAAAAQGPGLRVVGPGGEAVPVVNERRTLRLRVIDGSGASMSQTAPTTASLRYRRRGSGTGGRRAPPRRRLPRSRTTRPRSPPSGGSTTTGDAGPRRSASSGRL